MATSPRKRRKQAPGALSTAVEKQLERVERRARTIDELMNGSRGIAPAEFAETPPPHDAQVCSDREQRIRLLARRARRHVGLFHARDVVQLPPDTGKGGRHNR